MPLLGGGGHHAASWLEEGVGRDQGLHAATDREDDFDPRTSLALSPNVRGVFEHVYGYHNMISRSGRYTQYNYSNGITKTDTTDREHEQAS